MTWCREEALVSIDDAAVSRLLDDITITYTLIGGSLGFARVATQGILGDVPTARRTYIKLILRGPRRVRAVYQSAIFLANHGGPWTAKALNVTRLLIPPVGKLGSARKWLYRKHITILANMGRHAAVVAKTADISGEDVSTLAILRASAIRMTGSLDDAAELARTALDRAREEKHPVRVANAAFQLGLCLIWPGRLDNA